MSAGPWPVPVRLAQLNTGPVRRTLEADEAVRERVGELLDLVALERLTAEVEVAPWLDGAVVRGRWSARVVQACSLTAEDFASDLSGDFEVRCVPPGSPLAEAASATEIEIDPDAEDPPDVLEGDVVDVGAYVVEHLSLEIDPFARAPGAEFQPPESEPEPNPFAKLATLTLKPERDS